MQAAVERARAAARVAAMTFVTLGMLGGVRVRQRLGPDAERYETYQRWMKQWSHALLKVYGVRAVVIDDGALAPPPPGTARLVVANHRSPLDILLLLRQFGGVVLSRADLANWPVLGVAARSAETIFVDRADTMSGVAAARTIRERLRHGRTVIVFPEGTTHAGDEVRPFFEGAFAAARGLPVELVPVGIAYQAGSEFVEPTFGEHLSRIAARPETRVVCVIGKPRPMSGTRKEVSASLRAEIQTLVERARANLA